MKEKRVIRAISRLTLTELEISQRKKLVDWMCDIGDTLKLAPETVHRAVLYIDHIMCENRLEEKELQDIALICMLLSGKLTERDPAIERIISFFRKKMGDPKLDLMRYEVQVMSHLNWDLQGVTAMEFIQFFIPQGIVFTNDVIGCVAANEQSAKSLRQYVEFFADMCLQEYSFIQYDPLLLAAGIIAAGRKTLKFSKAWGKELEVLTTVPQKEAEKAGNAVLRYYEKLFPKNSKAKAGPSAAGVNKENVAPKTARPATTTAAPMTSLVGTAGYVACVQMVKRYL